MDKMPEQWIDVHDRETDKTGKDRIGVCKMRRQVTKLSKYGMTGLVVGALGFRWIDNPIFQAPPSRCSSGAKKMRMLTDAKTKVARPYLVGSANVAIANLSRSGL